MKTYIKRLSLRNFQSHRETDFEFTPGLNIIVGPSDQVPVLSGLVKPGVRSGLR